MDHCPHPKRPASTPPRVASSAAKASVASGPCRRRCVRARCASSPPRRLQPRAAERGQRGARPSRLERTFLAWLRTSLSLVSIGMYVPPVSSLLLFWIVLTLGVVGQCRDTAVPASVARRKHQTPQRRRYLDFEATLLGQDAVLPPHILLSQRLASIAKL